MVDVRRPTSRRRKQGPGSPGASHTLFSLSEQETIEIGRTIGRGLRGGELVLLEGELGLGKTVLAKGIAVGLGVDRDEVTSPSYTLVQEYEGGRVPLFHLDLYRLETVEDLGSIGLEEILAGGGVVLVEWGERLPAYLRRGAVRIRLHDVGEGSRQIEVLPDDQVATDPGADA